MRRLAAIAFFVLTSHLAALPSATVDGLKLHWTSEGKGSATLIFVHGWTCDSTSWSMQLPALDRKYRVVTLDLPGHGRSDSPAAGKFSMDLFARAVEAVRAEVGADKVVLVGHSMGAPVIRQFARLYPQHVAGLVAVDGPLALPQGDSGGARGQGPPSPERFAGPNGLKAREAMIRGMFTPQTPAALQEGILTMMLKAPEATAVGAMAAMFDKDFWKNDSLPMPALAVYAGTARLPNLKDLKKTIPNLEISQIAGTGHFLMMEKPEEFNRLLMVFVDKLAR